MEKPFSISVSINLPGEINALMALFGAAYLFDKTNGSSPAIKEFIAQAQTALYSTIGPDELLKLQKQMSAQFEQMQSGGLIDQAKQISNNLELKL
ncbi:MAG: hypothetical protein K9H61_02255 [Bacteroidia bacterium]|nr:hypothetical protein [Bacteroidia bacterium]MCF8427148.1 hypothetical protein [Bacteroidia bacterium]MCF8445793.1 hypothetical protein [Bacteroidia bacterium]